MGRTSFPSFRTARSTAYPLLIVGVVALLWRENWHGGLGPQDFPGHIGLLRTLKAQLGAGALPLWTPDGYVGTSLVSAYLHPIASLAALWPFTEVWGPVKGVRVGDSVFVAMSGLGMYAWCLRFSGSRRGAFLGALVYSLHPSVFIAVGMAGHVHQPVSMVLIPLVFLAWARLAERPSATACVLAMIPSSLLFLDVQRFWIAIPFVLAVYLAEAVLDRSSRGPLAAASRAALLAVAVALGMGLLLCFPLLPSLAERSLLQWQHPATLELTRRLYSLPHLLSLVDRNGLLAAGLDRHLSETFTAMPGRSYQGILALLFAALGAIALARHAGGSRLQQRLALTLVSWLGVLWLAFGVHAIGPRHLQLLADLGGSGIDGALGMKLAGAGFLALGWLAVCAYTLERALRHGWPEGRSIWPWAVGLFLGLLLFATPFTLLVASVPVYAQIRAPLNFAFPLLGFFLAVAVSLVTPAWERMLGSPTRVRVSLAIAVLLLLADVAPYREHLKLRYSRELLAELEKGYSSLKHAAPGRILDARSYNPLAGLLDGAAAGRASGWGWLGWSSSKFTSDVIYGGVYRSIAGVAGAGSSGGALLDHAARLAGLANVRFVTRMTHMTPKLPESQWLRSVWRTPAIEIYENRAGLPFAQFYPKLALLSGPLDHLLPAVASRAREGIASFTLPTSRPGIAPPSGLAFDYWLGERAHTLAPEAIPLREAPTAPNGPQAPCETTNREPTAIELQCSFGEPGYLVIAESWFPNWRVTLDGRPQPLLRLNHAFQGVAVDRGTARIEFRYRASGAVATGLGISALSWLALLGFGVGRSWRSDRGRRAQA